MSLSIVVSPLLLVARICICTIILLDNYIFFTLYFSCMGVRESGRCVIILRSTCFEVFTIGINSHCGLPGFRTTNVNPEVQFLSSYCFIDCATDIYAVKYSIPQRFGWSQRFTWRLMFTNTMTVRWVLQSVDKSTIFAWLQCMCRDIRGVNKTSRMVYRFCMFHVPWVARINGRKLESLDGSTKAVVITF